MTEDERNEIADQLAERMCQHGAMRRTDWRAWIATGATTAVAAAALMTALFAGRGSLEAHVQVAEQRQTQAAKERAELAQSVDRLRGAVEALNTSVAVLSERLPGRTQ